MYVKSDLNSYSIFELSPETYFKGKVELLSLDIVNVYPNWQ